MDKTAALLNRVKKAKENISNLKKMRTAYEKNMNHSAHCTSMNFSVGGFNTAHAVCNDETIFLKVIVDSIAAEEKLHLNDFKLVEAIEMLATNQIGVN